MKFLKVRALCISALFMMISCLQGEHQDISITILETPDTEITNTHYVSKRAPL